MFEANSPEGHKHIIGLMHVSHYESELVTLDDIRAYIEEVREFNKMVMGLSNAEQFVTFMKPVHSISDYGDRRRNVGLRRFEHCPECGAAINWKAIKAMKE
jgi:hypothetical protein